MHMCVQEVNLHQKPTFILLWYDLSFSTLFYQLQGLALFLGLCTRLEHNYELWSYYITGSMTILEALLSVLN